MNTEKFTGKARVYAEARPSYSKEAIEYICSLFHKEAVIADIGAGTGKFTELLAELGYNIYAVEPNTDMREQLSITLTSFSNARIVNAVAEATTLPSKSIDVITCAQALHWLDIEAFREECKRIGKPNVLVIAIYNITPGGSSIIHSKYSTESFFKNATVREFANRIAYTKEKWQKYMTTHSHDPLPTDANYSEHISEVNAIFERESINGIMHQDLITRIYSERIEN